MRWFLQAERYCKHQEIKLNAILIVIPSHHGLISAHWDCQRRVLVVPMIILSYTTVGRFIMVLSCKIFCATVRFGCWMFDSCRRGSTVGIVRKLRRPTSLWARVCHSRSAGRYLYCTYLHLFPAAKAVFLATWSEFYYLARKCGNHAPPLALTSFCTLLLA